MRSAACVLAGVLLFAWCSPARAEGLAPTTIAVLSYNVRGLFRLLARDNPRDRMPAIGWLANKYDVVLLQEDFEYPDVIGHQIQGSRAHRGNGIKGDPVLMLTKLLLLPITLPIPRFSLPYGSGLTSYVPKSMDVKDAVVRKPYDACSDWFGSHADCWARKGLLRVQLRTPGGAEVDFYNTHIDAGAGPRSLRARARNFEVLTEAIERLSPGRAVVVAGDFNVDYSRPHDREVISAFRTRLGLADSGAGPELNVWREHDFILFRGGNGATLSVVEAGEAKEFVSGSRALSDHAALFVRLSISEG